MLATQNSTQLRSLDATPASPLKQPVAEVAVSVTPDAPLFPAHDPALSQTLDKGE